MKTLNEYHYEYAQQRSKAKVSENSIGIACDHCGSELIGEKSLLLTDPPQQNIRCPSCKWNGRRFV